MEKYNASDWHLKKIIFFWGTLIANSPIYKSATLPSATQVFSNFIWSALEQRRIALAACYCWWWVRAKIDYNDCSWTSFILICFLLFSRVNLFMRYIYLMFNSFKPLNSRLKAQLSSILQIPLPMQISLIEKVETHLWSQKVPAIHNWSWKWWWDYRSSDAGQPNSNYCSSSCN
jgi:hypothetical protein